MDQYGHANVEVACALEHSALTFVSSEDQHPNYKSSNTLSSSVSQHHYIHLGYMTHISYAKSNQTC